MKLTPRAPAAAFLRAGAMRAEERRERTEWHTVVIHSEPLVRVAEQYLKKGSKVYVEGQLETRKWQDQSGADRYSTEIALRPFRSELTMLDAPAALLLP